MTDSGSKTSQDLELFANLADLGPADLLEFLEQMASVLPDELRYRLKSVLATLPPEGDSLQRVLELVRAQWAGLQATEWVKIAVVGPGQTGKSSLVEAIERQQEDPSRETFRIVDVQGLQEYLGFSSEDATRELQDCDVILLVLDARYGLSSDTLLIYKQMVSTGKKVFVALNKIDLVETPAQAVRQAKKALGARVFPTSVNEISTVTPILKAIVGVNPATLYPLARTFPGFRRTICNSIVTQASFGAGLVGAIPIPVSDMLPITAIQTAMLLKIARVFGFTLNRARARELVPLLAGGAVVREVSHRLRRDFPDHAHLIAVSVAGLSTFLLGKVLVSYFDTLSSRSREKLSSSETPLKEPQESSA